MLGSYLNGKQGYGSKWVDVPGSRTSQPMFGAGISVFRLEKCFSLENASVSVGGVEVQIQGVSRQVQMHGVGSLDGD